MYEHEEHEYVNVLELDADVENLLNAVDDGRIDDALRALVSASDNLGLEVRVTCDAHDSNSLYVSNGNFGFTLHDNGCLTHIGG
jgi:hypothetical protein